MGRAIATTLVALAVLTALVLAGVLTGLDEWGLDHVMPALDPRARGNGIVSTHGLWRPFPLHIPWWLTSVAKRQRVPSSESRVIGASLISDHSGRAVAKDLKATSVQEMQRQDVRCTMTDDGIASR